MADGQLSQVAVEILRTFDPSTVSLHVSQVAVETLRAVDPSTISLQLSQTALEVLHSSTGAPLDARLSQIALEALIAAAPPPPLVDAQLSQIALEVLRETPPADAASATQLVTELAQHDLNSAITVTQATIEYAWKHQPLPPSALVTQLLIEIIRRPRAKRKPCSSKFPVD